jgi:four helix bundle protein
LRNELQHFVGQARGSLAEIETQIEIARSLAFLSEEKNVELQARIAEIGRM